MSTQGRAGVFLTVLLITYACFSSLKAQASHQGDATVTLKGTNITLATVFKAIYKQTKVGVFYAKTLLDDQVTVDVNFQNTRLDEVLEFIVGKKGYIWVYNGNYVTIKPKPVKEITAEKHTSLMGDTSSTIQSVAGRVTDANGNPLIGATVQIKGSGEGTTTDVNGNFTLPRVSKKDILLISSLGYETRAVGVKGQSILTKLNVAVNDLDETVVVAYSTTTKRLNTGNISVVKGDEIAKQPVNNPLLALQGRVPGLFITQSTGVSGGTMNVQIRGQNSIVNGNDPFYVIDGVPYSSQLLPNIGGQILGFSSSNGGQSGSPLSFLNPDAIESITVLKDADATAIYGSRAANGVILITTKRGKSGQTRVDINLQQGWGKVARKLNLLDTRQYLIMRHEALNNDNLTVGPEDYDINGSWDTTRYTDWQKELIGKTTQYTNLNASVSGGNSITQYVVGATYHRETTVFPGEFSDRKGSVNFNINSRSANDRFKLQLGANYLVDNNNIPNVDPTYLATYLWPDAPTLYNVDGSLNWAPNSSGRSTFPNPLAGLQSIYKVKTKNLISNGSLSYKVLEGLDILCTFGYSDLQSDEFAGHPLSIVAPENRPFSGRDATFGNNAITSWIIEPQISFKRPVANGRLEALLGTSLQQTNSKGQQLLAYGYNSDMTLEDIRSASNVLVQSTLTELYKYNALFGKLNYVWRNRYIINLTGRRDGSSRFGQANRFHNFGSTGIAWIFSEENFIKNNIDFLSFGKLRASYGTTGSDQIPNYLFLDLYQPVNVGIPYQGGTALEPNRFNNPYLQWEETKKTEFGLETVFFKEKILFTASYFLNRSSNQLLAYTLPIFTGFGSVTRNFPATVQNSGWEFSINTKNISTHDFTWETNLNLTIPHNKLVSFPNLATSTYSYRLIIDQPITIQKVFNYAGVNQETGMYEFYDKQGKRTYNPSFSDDAIPVTVGMPKFFGGFQNSLKYKGIQLDFLFQFVKQLGSNYAFGNNAGTFWSGNQPHYVMDRWQKPGDNANIQRFDGSGALGGQYGLATFSNAAYSDASYIRLKNASVSWSLPQHLVSKLHLQTSSVYVLGQNLLTLTNYKGLDPETLSSRTLPPMRVITLGIKLGL
ncbi:SusC/RagA family TonB-linked outer membrane protein [Chitinophaga rupis]|nr:SusC/RagA family TonB-linked outer membrane protein [Chitinophaga rupis]